MDAKIQEIEEIIKQNRRNTNRLEKLIRKLKKTIRKDNSQNLEMTCESCYREGHLKENCFLLNKEYKCYNCGQIGHIRKTCPTSESNVRKYSKRRQI